jgi:Gluconate 2-dehydrogenase subunit 3
VSSTSRYPGYDVLDKWWSADWDAQTRAVVEQRLYQVPAIRFFTESERQLLEAVAERIVPQPDRHGAARVPIVPWIDSKLFNDERDGYRYEGMPPQREAWRAGLVGIDQTARALHGGRSFLELPGEAQDEVLRSIEADVAPGETWTMLPAGLFFASMLCTTIVKIYYAHPTAWSEVGYNGPSSPRGHMRIWEGGVDPWEAHEG